MQGDDEPGAEPVVVIANSLWEQTFGSDPGAIGRTVELDGVQRRVVGVMPDVAGWDGEELWTPLTIDRGSPEAGNISLVGIAALVHRQPTCAGDRRPDRPRGFGIDRAQIGGGRGIPLDPHRSWVGAPRIVARQPRPCLAPVRRVATDPVTLGGMALLLMVVATFATWVPARRASRIDPVEALRAE